MDNKDVSYIKAVIHKIHMTIDSHKGITQKIEKFWYKEKTTV